MNNEELFTRLFYYAKVQLNFSSDEFWLTPMGELLDLIECHNQFLGRRQPKKVVSINDVIPFGI